MWLMRRKSVRSRVSFDFIESKFYYKIIIIMEKKTSKVIVEVIKAVLYALLGLLGGNVVL